MRLTNSSIELDFDGNIKFAYDIIEALHSLYEVCGFEASSQQTNGIGSHHFLHGYTAFSFSTSILPLSSSYFSNPESSVISNINFKFREPVTENLNLYCLFVEQATAYYTKEGYFDLNYSP